MGRLVFSILPLYITGALGHKLIVGHVSNLPTMQFMTGIPRITQSNSYMLSLTECSMEFHNDVLWDTL